MAENKYTTQHIRSDQKELLLKLRSFMGETSTESKPVRVAKYLAHRNFGPKRLLDLLIQKEGVFINGSQTFDPAMPVTSKDKVVFRDMVSPKATSKMRIFCYHKACGSLTTHCDPSGRPTVMDDIIKQGKALNFPPLVYVGRLDQYSEGLLLFTNSGALKRFFEKPSHGFSRVYDVRFEGRLEYEHLACARKGVTVDGVHYAPFHITPKDSLNKRFGWCRLTLYEGKNREIRRIFAFWGLKVLRLKRIAFGPFDLGGLKKRQIREIVFDD